jgi:hypothetical protein
MNLEDVPEELVDAADLVLEGSCTKGPGVDETCGCPDDRQIRTILAAVIPRVLNSAADAIEAEALGPGHELEGAHVDAGIIHSAVFLRRTGWKILTQPGHKERLPRSPESAEAAIGPRPVTSA